MAAAPRQTPGDERRFGVTNDRVLVVVIALGVTLALWLALFAAYRFDRSDPAAVATLTVLLVVPPLVTYLMLLHATRNTYALGWQIFIVYLAALSWLAVQRGLLYPAFGLRPDVGESVSNLILLPAFGIAAWFGARGLMYRRRLATAAALQAQTDLKLLDAQLAPHLLFNMLNTVYAVMLDDRERAVPLFLAMSNLLRHVVDRTRRSWIALHEEVDFVHSYAELERARQPDHAAIAIDTAGDLDVPVPPMLLATLFENAVKHGRLSDGALDIVVRVASDDEMLRIEVINRCADVSSREAGLGLGLDNLRRRLVLAYEGRATLEVAKAGGVHRATITVRP